MENSDIVKFINNCGILEQVPTLKSLESFFQKNQEVSGDNHELKGGSLFYGTGLSTPREVSIGMPFDILGMIFLAHEITKKMGMEKFYHLIADTHAKTNSFTNPKKIDEIAKKTKETLTKVCKNLGIDTIEILLSSEIDTTDDYKEMQIYFRKESNLHDYVVNEMTDIAWFKKHKNSQAKLGWIIQGSETSLGSDERLFDQEYVLITGENHLFFYSKPGRTFNPSRPKTSPYIMVSGEERIPLDPSCNVKEIMDEAILKTGDKHLMGGAKHLEGIVKLYEKHMDVRFGNVPLYKKIQTILEKAFIA